MRHLNPIGDSVISRDMVCMRHQNKLERGRKRAGRRGHPRWGQRGGMIADQRRGLLGGLACIRVMRAHER
jgi:hypothetical protein